MTAAPTRIVCLSPLPESALSERLPARFDVVWTMVPAGASPEAVRDAVRDADIVIGDKTHRHRIDREALEGMKRCRLIHQAAVGYDTIDAVAAAELGIPVANSAGFNSEAVADWTVMAILMLMRRSALADRSMRGGGWPLSSFIGRELGSMTVGILGFGNAGRRVAERLRPYGCTLLHSEVDERPWQGSTQVAEEELFGRSTVVTLHTALTPETRGIVNAKALALMPNGSYLVNASRGPIVVQADLIAALKSGQLAGAALDVYEEEPLPDDSPLRSMDTVVLSPHVAGFTVEAEARLLDITAANVARVLDGEPPINVVNGVAAARA